MKHTELDRHMMQMALIGYEMHEREIQGKIAELRAMLDGRGRRGRPAAIRRDPKPEAHHQLSKKARKRIAEAQKNRWAKFRAARAASSASE